MRAKAATLLPHRDDRVCEGVEHGVGAKDELALRHELTKHPERNATLDSEIERRRGSVCGDGLDHLPLRGHLDARGRSLAVCARSAIEVEPGKDVVEGLQTQLDERGGVDLEIFRFEFDPQPCDAAGTANHLDAEPVILGVVVGDGDAVGGVDHAREAVLDAESPWDGDRDPAVTGRKHEPFHPGSPQEAHAILGVGAAKMEAVAELAHPGTIVALSPN